MPSACDKKYLHIIISSSSMCVQLGASFCKTMQGVWKTIGQKRHINECLQNINLPSHCEVQMNSKSNPVYEFNCLPEEARALIAKNSLCVFANAGDFAPSWSRAIVLHNNNCDSKSAQRPNKLT